MNLYEITTELQTALAALDETSGEMTPALQATLDGLQGDLEAKAQGIVHVVRNLQAHAEACASEAALLEQKAARSARSARGLKDYLKLQLERLGLPRLDAGVFKIRVQANPPSVRCDVPLEQLPAPLVKRREVVELDRAAVLEAARAGLSLPAGLRVEVGSHLRIS